MSSMMDLPPRGAGEIAVIGLARSGRGVAKLLKNNGYEVYASDAASTAAFTACAKDLRALGIEAQAGGHDLDRIGKSTLVVASPGVPPDAPPLAVARASCVRLASEVEVALDFLGGSLLIAVTATSRRVSSTRPIRLSIL